MPGFDGTGPRGMGPMTGGGRGFCNPWGWGLRGGFRRYSGFAGSYGYPNYGIWPPFYGPAPMTSQQDLDLLRSQARMMKDQLAQIESMIANMEKQTEWTQ